MKKDLATNFNAALLSLKGFANKFGGALLTMAVAVSLVIGVINSIALTGSDDVYPIQPGPPIPGALNSLRTGTIYATEGYITDLTATNLVGSSGFSGASATITDLTATTITATSALIGSVRGSTANYTTITGTLATPTQTNITSIGTLVYATINNLIGTQITGTLMTPTQTNVTSVGELNSLHTIGNALANSLTVTGTATANGFSATYLTGTLGTAAQPNITSVGALASATITDLTTVNVTGTLATANQPNVTNLGTQDYLTATSFSVANIKPSGSGSAANVNYCMSGDCDTGLYYPGDNNIGIATGGAVRTQVSNTGLDVTPTLSIGGVAFSGASKWGYSASQADMSTIAHGFATAPVACFVMPQTATISATVEAIDTSVFTVSVGATGPVFWMCGQ